jgi:hypothetical protein
VSVDQINHGRWYLHFFRLAIQCLQFEQQM